MTGEYIGDRPGSSWRTKVVLTLLISLVIAASIAFALYINRPKQADSAHGEVVAQKEAIFVYFPDESGKLQRKVVEAQQQLTDKLKADTLFRALKEAQSIPDRLRLYEMAQSADGVLYLNISTEFLDPAARDREIQMTYSIVNSFAESFNNVKAVHILVEGRPIYTQGGVLYLFRPLPPNKELMED